MKLIGSKGDSKYHHSCVKCRHNNDFQRVDNNVLNKPIFLCVNCGHPVFTPKGVENLHLSSSSFSSGVFGFFSRSFLFRFLMWLWFFLI